MDYTGDNQEISNGTYDKKSNNLAFNKPLWTSVDMICTLYIHLQGNEISPQANAYIFCHQNNAKTTIARKLRKPNLNLIIAT